MAVLTRAAVLAVLAVPACAFPEFSPSGGGGLGLAVVTVEGNSALQVPGGPSVFRDGLVVRGAGLDAADLAAELRGKDGAPVFALAVVQAKGARADLALPADLVEGRYDLVLSSGGGSVTHPLDVRRGAKGPPGTAEAFLTRSELDAALPDPSLFVDEEWALATFAHKGQAPDLSLYARRSLLDGLVPLEAALAAYAHKSELIDPEGYAEKEILLATYATPADLPDLSGAVKKSDLPDLSVYTTLAEAESLAVPAAAVPSLLHDKAAMDDLYLNKNGTLSELHAEVVRALVREALFDRPCPDGSVPVGASCVDAYEASVRDQPCGSGGGAYGLSPGDYAGLPAHGGTPSKPLYACSAAGSLPARYATWFQAARACAASGRRLCTEAEWQGAVAGTPDSPITKCRLDAPGPGLAGALSACISNHGVSDAVGNLAEWTADWGAGGPATMTEASAQTQVVYPWPAPEYGGDAVVNWNGSALAGAGPAWTSGVPAVVARGGSYASKAQGGAFNVDLTRAPFSGPADVGFRCCRGR